MSHPEFFGMAHVILELVRVFVIERGRGNFILDKAIFADVAGSYGEKNQRSIK